MEASRVPACEHPSAPSPEGRAGVLTGSRPALWLLLLAALLTISSFAAADAGQGFRLNIIRSGNAALDAQLEKALHARIAFPLQSELSAEPRPGADLILALGPLALMQTLKATPEIPVIALLVTSDAFERLVGKYPTRRRPVRTLSSIFYDAPLGRQALLGRLLIPGARRVAVLDGVESNVLDPADLKRLAELELVPEAFLVDDPANLIPVLNRALDYGDFLLGIPSPRIYNRNTIKPLLLTAYRRSRFLIGPSRAFVQAGALASTYTTLGQFADQATQLIAQFRESGDLPPPRFSTQFEIALNTQVARSLNLALPTEAQLKERLIALERRRTKESRETSP